jgi:hypothetical protein
MKQSAAAPFANAVGKIAAMLVGLSLLGAIGAGGYLAIGKAVALFASLDRDVARVTAIACGVALLSAWVIARGIRAASRQNRATAVRDEKAATYQLLLDFWVNRLRQSGSPGELPAELAGQLEVLGRLLALYGHADVIAAHTTLRDRVEADPGVPPSIGEMVVAIRRDVGTDTPHRMAKDLENLLLPPERRARPHTALARA